MVQLISGRPQTTYCCQEVGDLVTVDLYGPLPIGRGGVEYIFLVIDSFSKYVKLYALKKANVHTCTQIIQKKIIC